MFENPEVPQIQFIYRLLVFQLRTPTPRPSPTPKPSEGSVTSEWSETSVSSVGSWTRNFSPMRRFFDDQSKEHHHEGANLDQSCRSARSCFQCLHHIDSVDVSFNERVMGVGLSRWCVGPNVYVFATDSNVNKR